MSTSEIFSIFQNKQTMFLFVFVYLSVIISQSYVICEKKNKIVNGLARSRGISGTIIDDANVNELQNSIKVNTDNHDHDHEGHIDVVDATNSRYHSSYRSPSSSGTKSVFLPSYSEYHQHQQAVSSTPGSAYASSYLPRHLQYFNGNYYGYTPELTYSARKLRTSSLPDYVTDVYTYGGAPLYNSLMAIENEKDLLAAGSNSFGSSGPVAAATSHEHHGKGWGWKGWKGHKHTSHTSHTDYKVSAVNTDGLGLLGLLGLLSLFQLALLALTTTTTTTTTMAPGRRKRSPVDDNASTVTGPDDTAVVPGTEAIDSISQAVLPSLNVVAHVRNGKIPVNCTFQEVCRTNQLIVKNVEVGGTILGMKITDGIIEMLQILDRTPNKSLFKLLKESAFKGRTGENCEKSYPTCPELKRHGGIYSLPLLLPITHPYYYNHAQKMKWAQK